MPRQNPALTEDSETDEVAQLRAQIAELNARLAAAPTAALPARRRNGWWRPWVAGVLIAVAALIAPLSVVAMWAHDEVSDTDRYVETVGPLAATRPCRTRSSTGSATRSSAGST